MSSWFLRSCFVWYLSLPRWPLHSTVSGFHSVPMNLRVHRILSSTEEPCTIFASLYVCFRSGLDMGCTARAWLTFLLQSETALPRWHDLHRELLIASQQCTHCLSHRELHAEHFDSLWICGKPVLAFRTDVMIGVGLGVSPPHLPYVSIIKSSSHMLLY